MKSLDINGQVRIVAKLRERERLPASRCWLEELLDCRWSEKFRSARSSLLFGATALKRLNSILDQTERRRKARDSSSFDIARFVAIDCPEDIADDLSTALFASGKVNLIYQESKLSISSSQLPANALARQLYLQPGPTGVGAVEAWKIAGGDGAGIRFIDIEYDWKLDHDDLIDAGITLISGTPSGDSGAVDHGTSVLGIVAAQDNGREVTGIAHGLASAHVISPLQAGNRRENLAAAIIRSLPELRFGDVLLIELEMESDGLLPVEAERAVFEVLQLAANFGVLVVEPAGNGGQDLNKVMLNEGGKPRSLNRAKTEFQDSGALMVGGSRPLPNPSGGDLRHSRDPQSNYGSRVDCFAWAEGIMTTVSSSLFDEPMSLELWGGRLAVASPRTPVSFVKYCREFAGTSGASAILAGVSACVQGLAQQNLGFRLSPWQLRLLLRDPANGTHSLQPDIDCIGVMPDLGTIIDRVLGLAVDSDQLYLSTLNGDEISSLLVKNSPDLLDRGYLVLPFTLAASTSPEAGQRRIEILCSLPRAASVWLEMPRGLSDLEGPWTLPAVDRHADDTVIVPVNPHGQSYFREFPPAFCESQGFLIITGTSVAVAGQISARLMEGWQELSRITWTIPDCLPRPVPLVVTEAPTG
ncbi:MAG TPA: S8 family serine peptidase [Thermoanaerobaculia bacterium]|jgi:hypothetical protein|nr:S8 family serine peptidase [Thermoanaerobaculia bacterium]